MALDTYTGLQSAIADTLNRGDLTAAIPNFVALAEAQMARRFVSRVKDGLPVPRRLMTREDASIDAGAEYVAVPDGFIGPRVLTLKTDPIKELDFAPAEVFQQLKSDYPLSGPPRYYTVVGEELQLYPVADQSYTAELFCLVRPAALSGTNQSNWVLADHPDAYLYGSLAQSAPYLREDARVAMWASLFTSALDDICKADPMPSNKAPVRFDIPLPRRWMGRGYNINTDR